MAERKFKNSWSRLERATQHLAAFQAEWNALFSENPFGSVVRYDKDTGWFTASITADEAIKKRIANTTLPLILGEYVYQLRAALDGLIWDAITFTQGTEPPSNANRLEFPIVLSEEGFNKSALHKFPFPQQLKDWLESIQPYKAEKLTDHPKVGLSGALSNIHDAARLDRHRRLRVMAAFPTALFADIKFVPSDGFSAIDREGLPCDLLGGHYELLRFKVESTTRDHPTKVKIETSARFEVFFEDWPPLNGMESG